MEHRSRYDYLTLEQLEELVGGFKGKVGFVRIDGNCPVDKNGKLGDTRRLEKSADYTISPLLEKGAKLLIATHQGRVGHHDFISTRQHAEFLTRYTGKPIHYVDTFFGEYLDRRLATLENGEALMLMNTRMFSEEKDLVKLPVDEQIEVSGIIRYFKKVCDFGVLCCFGAAHRNHLTIYAIAHAIPTAASPLMDLELKKLSLLDHEPIVYLLGGIKIARSVEVIEHALERFGDKDIKILTAGVVGNLFLVAKNYEVGRGTINILKRAVTQENLTYGEIVNKVKHLLGEHRDKIHTIVDAGVLEQISSDGGRKDKPIEAIGENDTIYDIGPNSEEIYKRIVRRSNTIVANGPIGYTTLPEFEHGTRGLIDTIMAQVEGGEKTAIIAGGHLAAEARAYLARHNLKEKDVRGLWISTGGGSALLALTGKELHAFVALEESKRKFLKTKR